MARWKAFDLTWGRSIYACSACEEAIEVPTCNGEPLYNFCPMCGANMTMKSENKTAEEFVEGMKNLKMEVKQTDCDTCKHYKLACELFSEVCKYEPTTQTETQNSNNDTPQTEERNDQMNNVKVGQIYEAKDNYRFEVLCIHDGECFIKWFDEDGTHGVLAEYAIKQNCKPYIVDTPETDCSWMRGE